MQVPYSPYHEICRIVRDRHCNRGRIVGQPVGFHNGSAEWKYDNISLIVLIVFSYIQVLIPHFQLHSSLYSNFIQFSLSFDFKFLSTSTSSDLH